VGLSRPSFGTGTGKRVKRVGGVFAGPRERFGGDVGFEQRDLGATMVRRQFAHGVSGGGGYWEAPSAGKRKQRKDMPFEFHVLGREQSWRRGK